jgi:prophage maintenance system killer protein
MSRRATTPSDLARRLGTDVDDVLIMLWDAGLEYLRGPDSSIRASDTGVAESACGFASATERTTVKYWQDALEMTPEDFRSHAASLHIQVGLNARKLPKGALGKLSRHHQLKPVQDPDRETLTAAKEPPPKFEWSNVGRVREALRLLEVDEVERIHWTIAYDFADTSDPIAPAGVRFPDLLASALGRPLTGIGADRKYPTVEMATAALMHSLVHNHPFYNGNKRTAVVSMLSQLDQNGLMLTSSESELFNWTIRVAKHSLGRLDPSADRADQEVWLMSKWIAANSRAVDRGERVVTWTTLRQRLLAFDCELESSGNRGGRIGVARNVPVFRRRLIGNRPTTERRRYSLPYGGDGRQVGRGHIKRLRDELHLSEDYGYDSNAFYGSDDRPVDDFIAEYRKVLRRLAQT